MKKLLILFIVLIPSWLCANSYEGVRLQHPYVQLNDQASLQRGAKFFMNNCLSCHSLRFMRYDDLARGIGVIDTTGEVDKERVEKEWIHTDAKITDPILSLLTKEQAEQTFGVEPPDLSLVARSRGKNWLFTYLRTFYYDPSQPSGSNNLVFPNTAMPNLFEPLQGRQVPVMVPKLVEIDGQSQEVSIITGLKLERKGLMNGHQFTRLTTDLVAFLEYVAEPHKLQRYRIGVWVLLFLAIFIILAYLLKREYWQDVH